MGKSAERDFAITSSVRMKILPTRASALSVAVLFLASAGLCAEPVYDLVVYGSSPAAIAAAV